MANLLKVGQTEAIAALLGNGWSQRRIARELGIHRETVARYSRLVAGGAKPAISTPGSAGSEPAKPAISTAGSEVGPEPKPAISTLGSAGRRSLCEPWRAVISEKAAAGLSAQRIWQDLHFEQDFAGGYQSVKRFVRRLCQARPLPFRRMECGPGQEAQVDFGRGAPIVDGDGRRRRPHAFRITLSFSRKGYSEVVGRQTTEEFIRCLENAFWEWGGVPETIVIDNLRAAVSQADWYDPELNPKIEAFCRHYGLVMLPTKPRTPRHKGKIERGVGYVQDNGLKGRTFQSLAEENGFLQGWERQIADKRIHGTTRQQVGKVFEEVERPKLRPLPAERFPFFHEGQRSVHRDGHVEVERAYYSVPPEYVGRKVWARWDSRVVRVFDTRMKQIAFHARREPGRFSTDGAHIASEKISMVEEGSEALLRRARVLGPQTGRWAANLLKERGIQGMRTLVGLLAMTRRYQGRSIEEACRLAVTHGAYRLKAIRRLMETRSEQERIEFIEEHPLIRDMSVYGQFVSSGEERSESGERCLTERDEEAAAVGAGQDAGCPPAGGGGGAPEPCGVSGADLSG
jgi:transposase